LSLLLKRISDRAALFAEISIEKINELKKHFAGAASFARQGDETAPK
jgi:hypothetical protein